jgi:hypothetical protein
VSDLSRRPAEGRQRRPGDEGRPAPVGSLRDGSPARRARRPKAWSVEEAQAAAGEMADRMRADLKRLKSVHAGLTPPPDLVAREEHLKPYDVTTELLGCLEHLRFDAFPNAIETLARMARVTDAQLAREFERRRAGLVEAE